MAWSDKPTESQISELVWKYEAVIYDLQDDAKKAGRRSFNLSCEELLGSDTIRDMVKKIPNRAEASKAIKSRSGFHPTVASELVRLFAERGLNVDFEIC